MIFATLRKDQNQFEPWNPNQRISEPIVGWPSGHQSRYWSETPLGEVAPEVTNAIKWGAIGVAVGVALYFTAKAVTKDRATQRGYAKASGRARAYRRQMLKR